jgi:hypothetical protein
VSYTLSIFGGPWWSNSIKNKSKDWPFMNGSYSSDSQWDWKVKRHAEINIVRSPCWNIRGKCDTRPRPQAVRSTRASRHVWYIDTVIFLLLIHALILSCLPLRGMHESPCYILHLFHLHAFKHMFFLMRRCINLFPSLSTCSSLLVPSGVVSLNTRSFSRGSPQSFV